MHVGQRLAVTSDDPVVLETLRYPIAEKSSIVSCESTLAIAAQVSEVACAKNLSVVSGRDIHFFEGSEACIKLRPDRAFQKRRTAGETRSRAPNTTSASTPSSSARENRISPRELNKDSQER